MKNAEMKLVKSADDVPEGNHFAIVEFFEYSESTGYPEQPYNTEHASRYYVTEDRKIWEATISAYIHDRKKYVALFVEKKAKVDRPVIIS